MSDAQDFKKIIDDVISASLCNINEEEITESQWKDRRKAYMAAYERLQCYINLLPDVSPRIFLRIFILIGGCLGNDLSTRKLCCCADRLFCRTKLFMSSILDIFSVKSLSEMLKLPSPDGWKSPEDTYFDILIQEVSMRLSASVSPSEGDASLMKSPLLRDALIWATRNVSYPTLRDNRQLSIIHPFALQLLEDYRPPVKRCGFELLQLLSTEILVASWRSTGRLAATLDVLITHRSAYSLTNELLDLNFQCIFHFLSLLEKSTKPSWTNKLADLLLSDLTLEGSLERRILLTKHVATLLDMLGPEIMIHSRRLLKAAEFTLLSPRCPEHMQLLEREQCSYVQILNCLRQYVKTAISTLFPDLFTMVLPILVAFVDLEWNRQCYEDEDKSSLESIASLVSAILSSFIQAEPKGVAKVLQSCTESVPSMKHILDLCN